MQRGSRLLAAGAAVLACCLFAVPAVGLPVRTAAGLPVPTAGCAPRGGTAAPAATPWAQQALGFRSVWGLTKGVGTTVAVIDSGVDANPQFGRRVTTGPDLAGDPFGAAPGSDCLGHGTSVASIIAAAPQAGISFAGVAPAARILAIKIANKQDKIAPKNTAEAIHVAVEAGAGVINLSLASSGNSPTLEDAINFALANNVVVVAAAGNDEKGQKGPFYPAAYPSVLSVGAVEQDGSLAPFSDTRTPVSVTAPGTNITAAVPGTFPGEYESGQAGTSFAAAFVAGVAALVRTFYPNLDAAQVVARIEATADGAAGPGTGNGMVNPVQAVTAVLPAAALAGATSGAARNQGPVQITRAAPPDTFTRTVAMSVTAGAFALAVAVISAAIVIPAGRRRRWRPGDVPSASGRPSRP